MKVVMGNQAAREMAGFRSEGNGIGINPLDFVVQRIEHRFLKLPPKTFNRTCGALMRLDS